VQALVVVFAMLVSDKMTCFFLVSKASSSLLHQKKTIWWSIASHCRHLDEVGDECWCKQ
jgi:hypothetical protein